MAERLQEIVRLAVEHVGDLDEWSQGRTPQGMQQIWNEADTPASMLAMLTLAGQKDDAILAMLVTLEYVATKYEPKAAIQALALQAIITEEVANGTATVEEVVARFAAFVESVKAHRFLTVSANDHEVLGDKADRALDSVGAHLCEVVREVVPNAPALGEFVKGVKALKTAQRGMRVVEGSVADAPALEAPCEHPESTLCSCSCHTDGSMHVVECCHSCERCGAWLTGRSS